MLLFCLVIDPVLAALEAKGYHIIAYADDIIIVHDYSLASADVIRECQELVSKYGLKVNEAKCHSLDPNSCPPETIPTITFMGAQFTKDRPISLAAKLTETLLGCLNIIKQAPLTLHQ